MRVYLIFLGLLLFAGCKPESDTNHVDMKSLSERIDDLLSTYPEVTVGMSLRDEQTGVSYDKNPGRLFHAASTMKVPVMIEIYRQAALGRFSLDDELAVVNSFHSIVDSSLYKIEDDSDDAIYTKLGQQMSIEDLVFQMITVSSNLATNLLIDFVSADSVQATAKAMGVEKMRVLRGVEDLKAYDLGLSNSTTAADLALLLTALRDGKAVSVEADMQMVETLKAQAFNEMIPAGLPANTAVAHKTGWITAIHHDAGIVYPEGGSPYVLVILIEGINDHDASGKLGAEITNLIHKAIRG
ncbi:MAG: serine hydrolase [Rhodothermales bacterium]